MASVLWTPDSMFQDMSSVQRDEAAMIDIALMGSRINWLCDRSRLSMLASVNMLSGNVRSLLCDKSTMRNFLSDFNASTGMSIISFQESFNTCRFLVLRKQSKSTSTM